MLNLKNLGQELTIQQQRQVLGGARQLCFSCKVAGRLPTAAEDDLPPCNDCYGYGSGS